MKQSTVPCDLAGSIPYLKPLSSYIIRRFAQNLLAHFS